MYRQSPDRLYCGVLARTFAAQPQTLASAAQDAIAAQTGLNSRDVLKVPAARCQAHPSSLTAIRLIPKRLFSAELCMQYSAKSACYPQRVSLGHAPYWPA